MAEITVNNVSKSYDKTLVIPGLDLVIKNGEFVVILGPSGCGKSTLLRMIAGLEDINSGDITIGGTVVNRLEPRERGCAMVFQNYALYPHMTVADNIGYALKIAGVKKAARMKRIREVAATLELEEFLDRKPGQLSGGQRQRVAMGRAIIREPKVFLFDEPLSNLDAKLRVQMRLEIRKLHDRLSATSVFVTHDQVEAMTLADRLVVMNEGCIEQYGTPEEIYDQPASTYVANFIGAPPMNLLTATVSRDGSVVGVGDELSVDFGADVLSGLAGQKVTFGVRPEQVEWASSQSANAPRLNFEFSEELGGARLYYGKLSGAEFIMHSPQKIQVKRGEQLQVHIPLSAIHIFDESGRRVDFQSVETPQREIA